MFEESKLTADSYLDPYLTEKAIKELDLSATVARNWNDPEIVNLIKDIKNISNPTLLTKVKTGLSSIYASDIARSVNYRRMVAKIKDGFDPDSIEHQNIVREVVLLRIFLAEQNAVLATIPVAPNASSKSKPTPLEIKEYLQALFDSSKAYLYASGFWLNELYVGRSVQHLIEPDSATKFLFIAKVLDLAMVGIERLHITIVQRHKHYNNVQTKYCEQYLKLQLWYLTINAHLQRHAFVDRATHKLQIMSELMRSVFPEELYDDMCLKTLEMDFDAPPSIKAIYHRLVHKDYAVLVPSQSASDIHTSLEKCIKFLLKEVMLDKILEVPTPVVSPSPEDFGINPWADHHAAAYDDEQILIAPPPPIFMPFAQEDWDIMNGQGAFEDEDHGLTRLSKIMPVTNAILFNARKPKEFKVIPAEGEDNPQAHKTKNFTPLLKCV